MRMSARVGAVGVVLVLVEGAGAAVEVVVVAGEGVVAVVTDAGPEAGDLRGSSLILRQRPLCPLADVMSVRTWHDKVEGAQ